MNTNANALVRFAAVIHAHSAALLGLVTYTQRATGPAGAAPAETGGNKHKELLQRPDLALKLERRLAVSNIQRLAFLPTGTELCQCAFCKRHHSCFGDFTIVGHFGFVHDFPAQIENISRQIEIWLHTTWQRRRTTYLTQQKTYVSQGLLGLSTTRARRPAPIGSKFDRLLVWSPQVSVSCLV